VVAPARFARNIAVDTAGQQSATSFVISFSGRRCPSAKDAFIRTANAFCNGASLYFPWPGTKGDEEELPKMLLLWPKEHRHDLPTSDAKPPQASAAIFKQFVRLLRDDTDQTVRWAEFQFTREITEQYFSRASCAHVANAAEQAFRILALPEARRHCVALDGMLLDGKIRFYSEHDTFRTCDEFKPAGGFPRDVHYVMSYIYSVYARGWSYNWHLKEPGYRYKPLWLREYLLSGLQGRQAKQDLPAWQFPWGELLAAVIERDKTVNWHDWSRVEAALNQIRAATATPSYKGAIRALFERPQPEYGAPFLQNVNDVFQSATGLR
jgi:hypothetical protein